MDAFSLLKFWRNAAGETSTGDFDVRNRPPETDDEDSFFDLVLTGPDCEFKGVVLENNPNISSTSVGIKSFDNDSDKQLHQRNNTNKLSKRDGETKSNPYNRDSFSIRKILPIETNSKPQSPTSLLRSPPKFRVFMLGFKKSSSLDKTETSSSNITSSMATPKREQSKPFSMRYRVQEVPITTFLGRDNSLRSKMQRECSKDSSPANESFKKDVGVYKYLKMIKPLYVRASNIRIFEPSTTVTPLSSPASVNSPRKQAEVKQGSRAVFRDVYRNLMKSRWASSAVGAVPALASKRDDSALQQQDGIQSAILHCKRSYSSSSSSTISQECTMLLRSASDSSSIQRAFNPPRRSAEEEKRSSI